MALKATIRRIGETLARATGIPQQLKSVISDANLIKSRQTDVDRGTQILLGIKYRELASRASLMAFNDVEFRNYSQNGEDGILWYLFSVVGTTNKKCIEICAGNGTQCNTANLLINHGWTGLL